jgi:uncharacterized glyoxalase superfamily protein PhnB
VTDPFEHLVPSTDTIDPLFADRLRARVERALGTPSDGVSIALVDRAAASIPAARPATASPSTPSPSAASLHQERTTMSQVITPYLCVHDADAALEWYREFFGATVRNVIPWEGRVGHAEVDVSGAIFYLSDEAPDLGVVAPVRDGSATSVSIVLQVAVVEEFVERAERGGAVVQRPIEEAHGSRSAWIVDPFGHRWNVGTPVYDESQMADRRRPSEPYYMTFSSSDVERAAVFYGTVLGWESEPQGNGGRHVVNTDMPIGLRATEGPFGDTAPGEIQMWWTVRDFDDAVERVRVAGGRVAELNAYDSGREAICEDDQGVTFKLSEPAPGYDR